MRSLFSGPVAQTCLSLCAPLLFWVTSSVASAEITPNTAPPSKATLAAEPFVVNQWQSVFSFNDDGTGFRDQTFSIVVQSEAALRTFSVVGAPFASASERVSFPYARVRHPDGTVVDTATDASFEQALPVTQAAPLYSDLKQKQLPIKSLRVGDTLEWQVHVDRFKAESPGQFWGHQDLFTDALILSETVELRVPANRAVTVWTSPAAKLEPTLSTASGQRIYHWATAALAPTVGADADAAKKAKAKRLLTPAEELDATLGKLPDLAWTSFPSWAAVGAWYASLEAGRTQPDPTITAKVKELTADKTSTEDKVRAVYGYVSGQIHYIGVDLGIGRFQPHAAAAVLDNQYGDCKDKHTLLAAMLAALGLHPDAVLIGSGIRFNEAVPSPDSFNHLITHVLVDKADVWLDSTAEVAPYRMLLATLRDKPSLVVPEAGPASVEKTPPDPPFPTFVKMTAVGSLDKDGNSDSHFTLTERGDEELLVREVLRQMTPAQYDDLTQALVVNFGFAGKVSHAQFLHTEDTSQPLVMEWDYHREKAGNDWENLRTIPQVLTVLLPNIDEKEPPVGNIQLLGAREITATAEMKLPEGWSAELPEAVHANSGFGTYDLTYRAGKGSYYAERHWKVLRKEVPQADWKRYKAWTDAISLGSETYVQLTKPETTNAGNKSSPKPIRPAADPESLRLIAEAYKAIQANKLDQGTALLDKANALDSKQQNLWGDYGWVAYRRGNHVEALQLYKKEIDSYPDSLWAYGPIGQLQLLTGDHEGAIATAKSYIKQAPDDPKAESALISLLLHLGRNTEAAAEADAALTRLPENTHTNTPFQLAVAKAQLRGGEPEKGKTTAEAILANTTDPMVLNAAVYALAVAGVDLPLAERTEREILAKLTEESRQWTLEEAQGTLRVKSDLLAAAWDTMGWVLYREGRVNDAESYIEARWRYSPDVEVGQHLGQVQGAQGLKTAALHSYGLALATIPPFDDMGVRRKEATPEELELNARITALGGGGSAGDLKPELQGMRTFPTQGALGHDAVVEYKLLLSVEGVRQAQSTGAKDLAGGADLLLKTTLPKTLFPSESDALLFCLGTLNCHSGRCELILHR